MKTIKQQDLPMIANQVIDYQEMLEAYGKMYNNGYIHVFENVFTIFFTKEELPESIKKELKRYSGYKTINSFPESHAMDMAAVLESKGYKIDKLGKFLKR